MTVREWEDLQQIVIGYIYMHGVEALTLALTRMKKKYFNKNMLYLWGILVWYHNKTLGVPQEKEQFRKVARAVKMPEEKLIEVEELLMSCMLEAKDVDEAGFIWHLGRLQEVYRHLMFEELLIAKTRELEKEGYSKVKESLLIELSNLESGGIDLSQEGDIVQESGDVLKEIRLAREERKRLYVETGLRSLDRYIFGLFGGDLVLIAGWTGVGKTCLCVNIGTDAVFNQKKNVVYVTTETIRKPVRRRVYSRITKLPYFRGYAPLPVSKMKRGELTDEENRTVEYLVDYLTTQSHGIFQVVQAPARATVNWLRGKLLQFESQFKVDLVIVDDLRSMTPVIARRQEYEDISQIVRDLKAVARTHANRGVPIISPHHINRDSYKNVKGSERVTMFDLAGLASSSETEKRSDIIVGMWYDPDQSQNEIRLDILKQRDGSMGQSLTIGVEWEYQYMFERESPLGEVDDE